MSYSQKAERRLHSVGPGPAMYAPKTNFSSRERSQTSGGRFMQNDRFKYMGDVDPVSLTPSVKCSPGPVYNPSFVAVVHNPGTVSFGGSGPGTMRKPPVLAVETPGPGAYTPDAQNVVLSTTRRAPSAGFLTAARNGDVTCLSPGPCYYPSDAAIRKFYGQAVIGTAKRFPNV